jgi:hypothetical protein
VADIIRMALSKFAFMFGFLLIGLVVCVIALARAPKPLTARVVVESLLGYFILLSIGLFLLWFQLRIP